jgi:hypothetical protein
MPREARRDDWRYDAYSEPTDYEESAEDVNDVPIIGTLLADLGGVNSRAQREAAERARQTALAALDPGYVAREWEATAGPSAAAGIAPPGYGVNRGEALMQLAMQGVGAQDYAAMRDTARAAQDAGGQRRQMTAQLGAQGMGRSGAQLGGATQMAGHVGRASGGAAVAGDTAARMRALQALGQSGRMLVASGDEDLRQGGARAGAMDQRAIDDMERRRRAAANNAARRNQNIRDRAAVHTGTAEQASGRYADSKDSQQNIISGLIGAFS